MSEFEKLQKDIQKSKAKVVMPGDNLEEIKKKLGNKYITDISDSDNDDDLSTYKQRHNNFIEKNISQKNKIIDTKPKKKKALSKEQELKDNKQESEEESEEESVNESDDISITDYEFKDEFIKLIKEYVNNDDEIRNLKLKIKELNTKKDASQPEIMKHLEKLGDSCVKINGGALRINQYESKAGLKETLIKEAIEEKIKNPKILEAIMENIEEKRENNKKIQKSLKRTYERKK
jgi:hypothetical protein